QLQHLISEAGFKTSTMYCSFPHYSNNTLVVRSDTVPQVKRALCRNEMPTLQATIFQQLYRFVPSQLLAQVCPSLICVAKASEASDITPRMLRLLVKAEVIKEADASRYEPVLMNSR